MGMGTEAVIEEIYIALQGGAKMRKVGGIQAIAGFGLTRDRYSERKGVYSGIDECQVTLIEGEGSRSERLDRQRMQSG